MQTYIYPQKKHKPFILLKTIVLFAAAILMFSIKSYAQPDCNGSPYEVNNGVITPTFTSSWQGLSGLKGTVPYWSFSASAGTFYYFANCMNNPQNGNPINPLENTYLRIFNSSFSIVASNNDNGTICTGVNASLTWLCPSSGTYYVMLSRDTLISTCDTLSHNQILGYKNCAPPSIPSNLFPANGHYAQPGISHTFSWNAVTGSTPVTYKLYFNGTAIWTGTAITKDTIIPANLCGANSWYVVASNACGNTSSDTLTINVYPNSSPSTNISPLTTCQSQTASLAVDEADYYSFSALSGNIYYFSTCNSPSDGWDCGSLYYLNTYMDLYDEDNTCIPIASNDDGGSCGGNQSYITWTCPATGNYYIRIVNVGALPGPYSFQYRYNDNSPCETHDLDGADLIISSDQNLGGDYIDVGTFKVNGGYTVTVGPNCNYLNVYAQTVIIEGMISGNAKGSIGGNGGSGGGSGNTNHPSYGGNGGAAGSGSGGGGAGTAGTQGGHSDYDCGWWSIFICLGGDDGYNGGGAGGGSGAGGSYGNNAGSGGNGGNGMSYGGQSGGSGGSGGSVSGAYGTSTGDDITYGSGGGGGGGGGGAYGNGGLGGQGGAGGGQVKLVSTGNMTISGSIQCNGANGQGGGTPSGNSTDNGKDCSIGGGYGGWCSCFNGSYQYDAQAGAGSGAGGGSGGGILLNSCGNLTVSGSLEAKGGNGGGSGMPVDNGGNCASQPKGGAGGSGGRIKIFRNNTCATNTISGLINVDGGTGGNGYTTGSSGGTGTKQTALSISVDPLTPGSIGDNQTTCWGTAPEPIGNLASATGGCSGASFIYQWMSCTSGCNDTANYTEIAGANEETYSPPGLSSTTYFIRRVSNGCTDNTDPVIVTITTPDTVEINITSDANVVCAGTAIHFTANAVNQGDSPEYQWILNGVEVGSNSSLYTLDNPANGDKVWCVLTSNHSCTTGSIVTSNSIVITVNPNLVPSVSIAVSPNDTVCEGVGVTFTATPVNGGVYPNNPTYQWYDQDGIILGAINSIFSYGPENLDQIYCIMTSHVACPTTSTATSNTIHMVVNPSLTISVNIVVSPNDTVCQGTGLTFTATVTDGGPTPSYQWTLNGGNVGTNSSEYILAAPVFGNIVNCIASTSATCTSVSSATSNSITITINSNLTPSVGIASDNNYVCSGTSVTFTVTTSNNGGPSPSYQWYVGGLPVDDATNSSYEYIPINDDQVFCVMTSSANCLAIDSAISNTIIMVVDPNLPVSIDIDASPSMPVCQGEQVTFTATPTNGGSSPSFQWKVNSNPVGTNSNSYSYAPIDGDSIVCELTSNETCISGNPITSDPIIADITPNVVPSVSITVSPNDTICTATTVLFTAVPINGGTPTYHWYVNGVKVDTATNPTFSFVPVDLDQINCVMTSNATCHSPDSVSSNIITMSVNSSMPVSASITSTPESAFICAGEELYFKAYPTNAGTNPTYQWLLNGSNAPGVSTNSTYSSTTLADGDDIQCIVTANDGCPDALTNPATSTAIEVNVSATLPVSITISVDANPVCPGTGVTYTATPVNEGSSPTYQWQQWNGVTWANIVGAINSPTYFDNSPGDGDSIRCVLTSSFSTACSSNNPATSNKINMHISSPSPVSVSIVADPVSATVCEGTSILFTANPVNGGSGLYPQYQWYKNGIIISGATDQTYSSSTLLNNEGISCIVTSNANCASGSPASSNTIYVTINPYYAASISIAVSPDDDVCQGTTVTFTATPTNGGFTPSYQWKKGGLIINNATNSTYSYIPVDNDAITCVLTSSITCNTGSPATSNEITMNVNPGSTVSVSIIQTPSGSVCANQGVTFTADTVNAGSSPTYKWYVDGALSGSASSYHFDPLTFGNGTQVICVITSNVSCPLSNPASDTVIMSVNPPLPVSVSIAASENPICVGTSVTFTATPTNGVNPTYHWHVNGGDVGTDSPTYITSTLTDGQIVTCIMTSEATCAFGSPDTSNAIIMDVVDNVPTSVSIEESDNSVCAGTLITFTATPNNSSPPPSYLWYVNGISTGVTANPFSYIPANNDEVVCRMISNATCPSGSPAYDTIVMTVNPLIPLSVSIVADTNYICNGTLVTFTATVTNGGSNPTYQWQKYGVNVGTNSSVYSYTPIMGDVITCIVTSDASCLSNEPATSNAINMYVSPGDNVSVDISASIPGSVCASLPVTFTAAPTNGGTLPIFHWFVNGVDSTGATTSPTYTYSPKNLDEVYCVMYSNVICPVGSPAVSDTIIITVNQAPDNPEPPIAGADPSCGPTTLTALTPLDDDVVFFWQGTSCGTSDANPATSSYPVTTSGTYYISAQNMITGCWSLGCGSYDITIDTLPSAPTDAMASPSTICSGQTTILSATPGDYGEINWYIGSCGGAYVGTGSSIEVTPPSATTYYYSQETNTITGCVGNTCAEVLVTKVTVSPPSFATAEPSHICAGSVTVLSGNVGLGGDSIYWYTGGCGSTFVGAGEISVYPTVTTTYYAMSHNSLTGCNSTCITIIVTVDPGSEGGNITPFSHNICIGDSTGLMTDVNYFGTIIKWQSQYNGGGWVDIPNTTNHYADLPTAPGTWEYIMVVQNGSSCDTAHSSAETVHVLEKDTINVHITVSPDSSVCSETEVTFTATTTANYVSYLDYQWYVNGLPILGETNETYTFSPSDQDEVYCVLSSSFYQPDHPCTIGSPAESNHIVMTIASSLTAEVDISSTPDFSTPVCGNVIITFTATPENGGLSPTYQWLLNGDTIVGETNDTFVTNTLSDGDLISCEMTSSFSSSCINGNPATSDPIVVTFAPAPALSLGTPSTICVGQTIDLFAYADGDNFEACDTVYWYTGSCGGTLVAKVPNYDLSVDEFITNVQPPDTTDYYIVAYDNSTGCYSACVSQTVNVQVPDLTGLVTDWYIWAGYSDFNWATPSNWVEYNGVSLTFPIVKPDTAANVLLTTYGDCFNSIGFAYSSIITPGEACHNLKIDNYNCYLSMEPGCDTLNIYGNFENRGYFNALSYSGTVSFKGKDNVQELYSNYLDPLTTENVFYNMDMNKKAGNVVLTNVARISNSLTFNKGNIETGIDSLLFASSASNLSESNSSRIIGRAFMEDRLVFSAETLDYLGLLIGSGSDQLGSVHISRYTGNGSGYTGNPDAVSYINSFVSDTSIACYWVINSTLTPDNGRPLTFRWLNTLDNGNDFSSYSAKIWKSDDGASWAYVPDSASPTQVGSEWQSLQVNTTTFSKWTVSAKKNQDPLPVELLDFKALCKDSYINLSWSTASETNNDYFTIERSIDVNTWKFVTNVRGAGNSNQIVNYNYTDMMPYQGISYYRLLQTDFDGNKRVYSPIITDCGNTDLVPEVDFYPNPFTTQVLVSLKNMNTGPVKIAIYDMLGKMVYEKFYDISSEDNNVVLDIGYLPEGIYIAELKSADGKFSKKLVKSY